MLRVTGLSKTFGQLAAVTDVSFDVAAGTVKGLIGPNGSGKTTIFNLISGFLKPSSGKVELGRDNVSGMRPHKIARRGLVRTFQLTSVYRELTARENLTIAHHLAFDREPRLNLFPHSHSPDERTDAIFEMMGLTAVQHALAGLLPGGTQRKLSIATALAAQPKMLLLDEPLAGLHPSEKAEVISRLAELKTRGLTMLLVEHDMRSVMAICDDIIVLNFGRKLAEGTPSEIQGNSAVAEAYLGAPVAQNA